MSKKKIQKKEGENIPTSWKSIRTAQDLAERVQEDPWLEAEIKKDPGKVIAAVSQSPLDTDVWIYRIVVFALGVAVLISLGGAIAITLIDNNTKVPDVLVALGSAAVGALAGLLAPSPSKKGE